MLKARKVMNLHFTSWRWVVSVFFPQHTYIGDLCFDVQEGLILVHNFTPQLESYFRHYSNT